MLGYYKLTREKIVNIIRKSPITKDGYYFCKEFRDINTKTGDFLEKNEYIYCREMFENKVCFTNADIETYLEKDVDCCDIYAMKKKDDYLYDVIKDDVDILNLHDKIDEYGNTFEDVIDTCIFIINNKK